MNRLIQAAVLVTIAAISAISLWGCSSGLRPETFEVTLNSEYSPGITFDRTYTILTIRSLIADPISVTEVAVNQGCCRYTQRYGKAISLPAHFQMGQVLTLYLQCPSDSIVQVDVETDQGSASYSFK